jgi:hypothetical protein
MDEAAAEKEAALAAALIRRVDEIEEALLRLAEVRHLRREVEEPPAGRYPVFALRPARKLARDLAAPLDALRARLGG